MGSKRINFIATLEFFLLTFFLSLCSTRKQIPSIPEGEEFQQRGENYNYKYNNLLNKHLNNSTLQQGETLGASELHRVQDSVSSIRQKQDTSKQIPRN